MDTLGLSIGLIGAALIGAVVWWWRARRGGRPFDRGGVPQKAAFLHKIDKMILASTSLDDIAYEAVNLVTASERIVGAVMRTVDRDGKLAVLAISDVLAMGVPAFARMSGTSLTPGDGTRSRSRMVQAVNTRQMVSGNALVEFEHPPLSVSEAREAQEVLGIKLIQAYPIVVEGAVAGVLTFYLQEAGATPWDVELMQAVTDEVGIAVKNTRLVDRLEGINATLEQINADLQQANATKDEFISIASHQLRSPLTAIKGHLSMLLEGDYGKLDRTQRPVILRLAQSTNEVINIINDMLSVSRINAGKFELNYAPVQLEDLVSDVVAELRPLAQLKELTLTVKLPRQPIGTVYMDALRMRQVMINFLDNAIKYTNRGSVKVTLCEGDGTVRFMVEDTGIGIPEEEQKELFAKFFRAANARQQVASGSGLGLFVAKQIVAEHGGTVIVESVVGKGSRFGFEIALQRLQLAPRNVNRTAVTV